MIRPAVRVASRLVGFEIFARDVRVAAPHHQLVHSVSGSGSCDERGAPAVAPAQHRVPADAQRLEPERRKRLMTVTALSVRISTFGYDTILLGQDCHNSKFIVLRKIDLKFGPKIF